MQLIGQLASERANLRFMQSNSMREMFARETSSWPVTLGHKIYDDDAKKTLPVS